MVFYASSLSIHKAHMYVSVSNLKQWTDRLPAIIENLLPDGSLMIGGGREEINNSNSRMACIPLWFLSSPIDNSTKYYSFFNIPHIVLI